MILLTEWSWQMASGDFAGKSLEFIPKGLSYLSPIKGCMGKLKRIS
jgi:hypothetical protein